MCNTQAQATQVRQQAALTQGPSAPPPHAVAASPYGGLYPSLEDEYMGLQLTQYRTVSGTEMEATSIDVSDRIFIHVDSTSITSASEVCMCL